MQNTCPNKRWIHFSLLRTVIRLYLRIREKKESIKRCFIFGWFLSERYYDYVAYFKSSHGKYNMRTTTQLPNSNNRQCEEQPTYIVISMLPGCFFLHIQDMVFDELTICQHNMCKICSVDCCLLRCYSIAYTRRKKERESCTLLFMVYELGKWVDE